ncbi:Hypothetical protein NTJ_14355 [Nesidiocoris tenuis]|uniref:Uncharacterized protein n=1 Tax=Nesidiocoris tenuis TaxID=355587 RepID=A0ABN7BB37_9HEMI|nr:Hypothetical protein NTJ_14355 [Nesidiocoris tenuis]
MYEGERPIAASSPKLKPIAKRKAKNSRHSVSLLDVSAVEVIPEVTSQKCESFSNETLTSVCKDSGYVRSESSFSAEDEPKASGKKLIDELKQKQILIDELQESNRGLRIRCADAENKIFELRVKCESHCDCCQKDPPPPNESDGRWNWRHSHVETQSKDFFNFRRNPFSNSFKFDETGREIGVARLNRTCPSRLHREAESSSSEELALPGIAYQHLQDGNEHQTAEDLSLSKVEWWQSELLSKKRPNRTANAHALKVQRSKSDLDGLFQAKKVPESNSIGRPNLAKHGSLHRLHDYLASSTDDLKSKRFSRPSPFWSTSGSPSRNNSLSNLASSFAELSIEDVKTDRISKLTDSRSPAHRQPISDAQNDAENCIRNLQNLTCQPAFSKECQTEGDRTVASDRICCCQSRTQVPYVIIVPTAGCCASANQHIQDLHCWRGADGCGHSGQHYCGNQLPNYRSKECGSCQNAASSVGPKIATSVQTDEIGLNNSHPKYCSCKSHCPWKKSTELEMVDPKEELKRRIEEGMQRIASDCRAEINSLSFKPWPPPNFTNMSPLVRCLAETSQYVRRIAVGLDEATGHIRSVSSQIRQTNPSF